MEIHDTILVAIARAIAEVDAEYPRDFVAIRFAMRFEENVEAIEQGLRRDAKGDDQSPAGKTEDSLRRAKVQFLEKLEEAEKQDVWRRQTS